MGKKQKQPQIVGSNKKASKLSPQKRNELSQLVEKLLKVSSGISSAHNTMKSWDLHVEIDKLLTKIMILESDMCLLSSRKESNIDGFTKWMEENGSKINGVEIAEFPNVGYGLKATKNICENDLMITVPKKLMLTSDDVANSPIGQLASQDLLLQTMPNVCLSLLLLIERFNKDSFWSPYISLLPSSYNTVMYFGLDELKELKGSPTYEAALKQCKSIARQYAYFYKIFQRADTISKLVQDIFTFEHYRWAVSTVMTRQNFVPSSKRDGQMINALIPFWDMANHVDAKMTTDYNVEKEENECFAFKNFLEGEQVFISYGNRANQDLFLHNAFVYPGNTHDSLKLSLGIAKSDACYDKKCRLLGTLSIPSSGQYPLFPGSTPVVGQLLSFLRVFCMNEENLDKWLNAKDISELGKTDCHLDPSIDSKVWEFMKMRIKLLLSAYPTTLEEDEIILSSEEIMGPHLQLILLLRVGEKKILHNALEYINNIVKIE